uniref:Putative c2h2-type zn-finger protein n=2 Tax=Ixodes ricinus TaxID=34613 RepID=A0A147BN77_IXORI
MPDSSKVIAKLEGGGDGEKARGWTGHLKLGRPTANDQRETPRAEAAGAFACGECESLFSSRDYLDKHRKTVHRKAEGRHQCHHCPYSSDRVDSVVAHERTHTGEMPFVCSTCGKAFAQQGHLARHRRVHSGERPHECATCGQRLAHLADLRRHERTHTGERPHVCSECGKGFTQKSVLVRHVRTHSGARVHACHLCEYRGGDSGSVRKHVIAVHSKEYPHACEHCGKGFVSPCELRAHLARKHTGGDQK